MHKDISAVFPDHGVRGTTHIRPLPLRTTRRISSNSAIPMVAGSDAGESGLTSGGPGGSGGAHGGYSSSGGGMSTAPAGTSGAVATSGGTATSSAPSPVPGVSGGMQETSPHTIVRAPTSPAPGSTLTQSPVFIGAPQGSPGPTADSSIAFAI